MRRLFGLRKDKMTEVSAWLDISPSNYRRQKRGRKTALGEPILLPKAKNVPTPSTNTN